MRGLSSLIESMWKKSDAFPFKTDTAEPKGIPASDIRLANERMAFRSGRIDAMLSESEMSVGRSYGV